MYTISQGRRNLAHFAKVGNPGGAESTMDVLGCGAKGHGGQQTAGSGLGWAVAQQRLAGSLDQGAQRSPGSGYKALGGGRSEEAGGTRTDPGWTGEMSHGQD